MPMPRHSAAEAWPMSPDPKEDKESIPPSSTESPEASDETQEALDELKSMHGVQPNETRKVMRDLKRMHEGSSDETVEALGVLRNIQNEREAEAAAAERRRLIESRDKENLKKAQEALAEDMTHELDDDTPSPDAGWAANAIKAIDSKRANAPAEKPAQAAAKKPWWKRMFGSKES